MPRRGGGGFRSRPASPPPRSAPPPRPARAAPPPRAAAPPPRAAAPPPAAQAPAGGAASQGPGLMGQMAATAGGVAIGSVVGHGMSQAIFGGGGDKSSAPAEQPQQQQQPYQQPPYEQQPSYSPYQQQQQQNQVCSYELQQFLQCAQNQSDLSICEGMTSSFIFTFHLIALCKSVYTLYWHYKYAPHKKGYGGDWTYLTFISMVAIDLLELTKRGVAILKKYRDNFFAIFAFPLSIIVAIMFWGLYFYNRELVYPKTLDEIIPTWYNHLMHTTISVFMIIESISVTHYFPRKQNGMLSVVLLCTAYLVWIHFSFYMGGIWPYNILAKLKGRSFNIFCGCVMMLAVAVYLAGDLLNSSTNQSKQLKIPTMSLAAPRQRQETPTKLKSG